MTATVTPIPMPTLAETGRFGGAEVNIDESIVVLELVKVCIALMKPDVVGLENCEESRVMVAASSVKRFVVLLQHISGFLSSSQHQRPEGWHRDRSMPASTISRCCV